MWKRRVGVAVRHGLRALVGLSIGLALAEAAFWRRDRGAFPHLNVYVEDADRGVRLRAGATERISFAQNPVTSVRINAEGYRGAAWPSPAADEVVVVGDSQVFGLGVEEDETFSAALGTLLGPGRVVRNLGVPTYGPSEYNAAIAEALAKRPAKVVVYTVNVANDLFEATRPNRDRHRVWDGWAVRKETAPSRVTWFPGRQFLFTESHGFYALRRYLYERGPKDDAEGFASEGTWADIGSAASVAAREHDAANAETARLARLRQSEIKYTDDGVTTVQQAVEDRVIATARESSSRTLHDDEYRYTDPNWLPKADVYRAARLSPGDIVDTEAGGESSRTVRVSAAQIRAGAALRVVVEAEVRKRAEAAKDEKTLGLFAQRDQLEQKAAALRSAAPPKAVAFSPVAGAIKEAKAICDKYGARLLVVALPIDVQVSKEEWKKYGADPEDMEPTKVLLEDIVVAARAAGAEGIDATPALAAAEPGAFLKGDIHMTSKGHRALAVAIADALKAPVLNRPGEGLPAGRTWPPMPEEWTPRSEIAATESDPAGCETKRVREWLGIFCRHKGGAKAVDVLSGSDAIAGAVPGAAVLVAPLVKGQEIRATFTFEGETREFLAIAADDSLAAKVGFSKPTPVPHAAPKTAPTSADTAAFCACFTSAHAGQSCSNATTVADADCARTYGSDCAKLLACAAGDPAFAPKCGASFANAGATRRCHALCSAEVPCGKGRCVDWQGGHVCM